MQIWECPALVFTLVGKQFKLILAFEFNGIGVRFLQSQEKNWKIPVTRKISNLPHTQKKNSRTNTSEVII